MAQRAILEQLDTRRAFAHIVRLAGDIGVRVAGTDAEHAGAEYLADVFRAAGLEPTTEAFPVPVWRERRARLVAGGREVPAIGVCFSGRTTGHDGEIVPVGDPLRPDDLADIDLAGRIALVHARNVYVDYPDSPQSDLLLAHGAAGAIYVAGAEQAGGLPQAYYNFKRALHTPTPPAVIVAWDDAQWLAVSTGQATMEVEADITWSHSLNVVADLPGTDRAGEIVIISAHHDSTWTSPGAADNAAGCAVVAELARVFAAGPPPRRTLRFAQWGGHELGLFGSESWLHRHIDEAHRVVAVINFDTLGDPHGEDVASLLGSPSWAQLIAEAFASAGVSARTRVGGGGVDAVTFAALGRNAVNITRRGGARAQTPADTLEPLAPEGLLGGLRLSAALLAALAFDDAIDPDDAMPLDQLRRVQSLCARWGWGLAS